MLVSRSLRGQDLVVLVAVCDLNWGVAVHAGSDMSWRWFVVMILDELLKGGAHVLIVSPGSALVLLLVMGGSDVAQGVLEVIHRP